MLPPRFAYIPKNIEQPAKPFESIPALTGFQDIVAGLYPGSISWMGYWKTWPHQVFRFAVRQFNVVAPAIDSEIRAWPSSTELSEENGFWGYLIAKSC